MQSSIDIKIRQDSTMQYLHFESARSSKPLLGKHVNLQNRPAKLFTTITCDQTVHLIITVEPMLRLACASVSLFAPLTRLIVVASAHHPRSTTPTTP